MGEKFFLGKTYDLKASQMGEDPILYDPDDLTTHAIITGMTGSGKTGLGVIMLEEAALQGIPAIVVDPKGDLTNLLLHFPELLPADFQPWVDQDSARRDGLTVEAAAEKAAQLWKTGLASYGLGSEALTALQTAVDYAVYTPGSDAGFPVSILASFSAPNIPWEENKEILRERITSTVTALLGLIGFKNLDPIQAKEHILLANIFEHAWRDGKDLDMATLITHVQSPPFEKLGVFSLDQFYPPKERFNLAMLLNNFLASPAFQIWLEGQPLDIGRILYTATGKPRHSVFYLAHLSDEERMFFVTLLYTAIETWMRTQKGTSGLRALVYFDEIAGYLPPIANPASKNIILRMLKQARAFGVGLMLATQNPVDLDYKALSNAGTWVIGKLQTEQDKARLLDGLEGAAPGLDRKAFDRLISLLDKRVFLLHNVHEDKPQVFHTRWALNYLPGPLTRNQLPALNALVDAQSHTSAPSAHPSITASSNRLGQDVAPAIPSSISTHYFPISRTPAEAIQSAGKIGSDSALQAVMLYRPALVGQARVTYIDRKYNLAQEQLYTVNIDELQRRGLVRWENFLAGPINLDNLRTSPAAGAIFENLDNLNVTDTAFLRSLESDFLDWIYQTQALTVRVNEALDLAAGPDVSAEAFKQMVQERIEAKRSGEIESIKKKYEDKLDKLKLKLKKETMEYEEDQEDLKLRRLEEAGKGLENVIGLFAGRRRSLTTSLTKRRMTSKAKSSLEASKQDIENVEAEIANLETDMKEELETAAERWEKMEEQTVEQRVALYKKNIFVELFGVVWLPYYVFGEDRNETIVPAFEWREF